jgi:hypothetical protein
LGGVARRTLQISQGGPLTHLDDLLEKMEDTSSGEVMAALFEPEMQDPVKQLPGKNFVKVW